ncbi:MAG: alanine dehydrogenase [Brockia lithotrophica]|nr:alanine dehydrogenase [Brockia lithotrophica]
MIVGVPREIKLGENRVAITPAGVHALHTMGHKVLVERGAGEGSGIADDEFRAAGAEIVPTPEDVWNRADLVLKVKEPLPEEFRHFREGLVLFTYLHLAAAPDLARALLERRVTAIAYETVQLANGALPLLQPMSEVAGRLSVQIGAQFLQKTYGGSGVLLSGIPGVAPGKVVILGGGTVGTNAAKIAAGLGAEVVIFEVNADRLRNLDDLFGPRVRVLMSNPWSIGQEVTGADLVVGAVLIPGAKAPVLVTEDMVRAMRPGSVIVDVAVDQGGSIATVDRVTTHDNPVYERFGVLHYAVANIPGAVPRTSTWGLVNATLPYVQKLLSAPLAEVLRRDPALRKGLNTHAGYVTHEAVARSLGLSYRSPEELIA